MKDYGALVETLKFSGEGHTNGKSKLINGEFDPGAFFEGVKVQILEEMENANLELRRCGLAAIERILVPCYLGKLCLTFVPHCFAASISRSEKNKSQPSLSDHPIVPKSRERNTF